MSARPILSGLADEDLDLLLSRSIDGDLPAEEQAELDRALAADPAARRRRDELAGLVDELQELPAPEPPFALATRVNSQVAESSSGFTSAWHRFGLYPSPAFLAAAVGVFACVVVGSVFFGDRSPKAASPARPASVVADASREADGPVRVFFQDQAKREEPAAPPPAIEPERKAKQAVRENGAARENGALREIKANEVKVATSASDVKEERQRPSRAKDEYAPEVASGAAAGGVAGGVASGKPAPRDEETFRLKKSDGDSPGAPPAGETADKLAAGGWRQDSAAPSASRPAQPAAAAAPSVAGELSKAATRRALSWSVRIAGASAWRLAKGQGPSAPAPESHFGATYRLTLDAEGNVVSLRSLTSGPANVEVERAVKSLKFLRVEPTAEGARPSEVDLEVEVR